MRYLLDTNICIYLIKKRPHQVLEKFNAYSVGEIGVSSITVWIHSSCPGDKFGCDISDQQCQRVFKSAGP